MTIATEALNRVKEVESNFKTHEAVCQIRQDGVQKAIDELKRLIQWGGVTALGLILALLGWSLKQNYDALVSANQRWEQAMTYKGVVAPSGQGKP